MAEPMLLVMRKIVQGEYDEALELARKYDLKTDIIYQQQWKAADVSDITIQALLDPIQDRLWVLSNCLERIPEDATRARVLLEYGLKETDKLLQEFLKRMSDLRLDMENLRRGGPEVWDTIVLNEDEITGLRTRLWLLQYLDRLRTFEEIDKLSKSREVKVEFTEFAIEYALFRDVNIVAQAIEYARNEFLEELKILFVRHSSQLLPYRLAILDRIPETADPESYQWFLPRIIFDIEIGAANGLEAPWQTRSWREIDWVEVPQLMRKITSKEDEAADYINVRTFGEKAATAYPATLEIIQNWYNDRAHAIDSATGQVDRALSLVRLGVMKGVSTLRRLEEDLELLQKLVYECYPNRTEFVTINLRNFETLRDDQLVGVFLRHTDSRRVVEDFQNFVLPLLDIINKRRVRGESAMERPAEHVMYDYMLDFSKEHLEWVCLILENSRPMISQERRIIKSDEDLFIIAAASLYSQETLEQWAFMNRILECLPFPASDTQVLLTNFDPEIFGQFSAQEVFIGLQNLDKRLIQPFSVILVNHMNASRILRNYTTLLPLRWFLQSEGNYNMQKALCVKLAAQTSDLVDIGRNRFEADDEWMQMLKDLRTLHDNGNGVLGAVGMEEIFLLFLTSLLRSGKFQLAKEILRSTGQFGTLDDTVLEKLVLDSAIEFFDNSTSGNMNTGYLKMAYECLKVIPETPSIRTELDLIEAAHELAEYKLQFKPGVRIMPIQVRQATNRLEFVARLLSTNPEAYRKPLRIIQLVKKLGYQNDLVSEVRVLAMLGDAALRDENYESASKFCEELIDKARRVKNMHGLTEITDVCWRVCYEVGKQERYRDIKKRITLVALSMVMCPAEQSNTILQLWRKLEDAQELATLQRTAKPSTAGTFSALPASLASSTIAGIFGVDENRTNEHLQTDDKRKRDVFKTLIGQGWSLFGSNQ